MSSIFSALSFGQHALIAAAPDGAVISQGTLAGQTFGGVHDPLCAKVQTFLPIHIPNEATRNTDCRSEIIQCGDQFSIDGAKPQTIGGVGVSQAILTYTTGHTATVTAALVQDLQGHTYWVPEYSSSQEMTVIEAAPIAALTLSDVSSRTENSSEDVDDTACAGGGFAQGTRILTAKGARPVEKLRVGDLVQTLDNGFQPIRWISDQDVAASGPMTPIRICKGALGDKLPKRDLIVARQHRILVQSRIAARMFNQRQVLVSAAKLLPLPRVREISRRERMHYWHILCDGHEVVIANGAPAETRQLTARAVKHLSPDTLEALKNAFPRANLPNEMGTTRRVPPIKKQSQMIKRVKQNGFPAIEGWVPPDALGGVSPPR